MNRWIKYAFVMYEKYSKSENWYRIWFSDKVHFNYDFKDQLRIIRQADTRYRLDCIQHKDSPPEKYKKRKHAWATVDFNFKSDIYFYDVPGNSNEKMTHQVYIILYWSRLWSLDWKEIITSCWRKTVIQCYKHTVTYLVGESLM